MENSGRNCPWNRCFGEEIRILALAMVLLAVPCFAQADALDPHLNDADNAYLDRQAGALLGEVERTLEELQPQVPEPRARRLALLVIDGVLHETYAPARKPVQDFYHRSMENLLQSLESSKPTEGAYIWKLYNHGFIVRTPSVTLAFDVNNGPDTFRIKDPEKGPISGACPSFPMGGDWVEAVAAQCDVLFVSHRHADHAVEQVASAFLDAGKPVVAPEDVFEGMPLHERITHLKREAHAMQSLSIQDGRRTLDLVVYPGQQYQGSGVPNNVVLAFTPEGMSFAHNGDQINDPYPEYQEDYKWIDKVHEHHRVDVLMTNCWLNDIYRLTKGFDPRLVLPSHQNELRHELYDRVPYWGDSEYLQLTYPELLASSYPVLVLTWGERYHYLPESR